MKLRAALTAFSLAPLALAQPEGPADLIVTNASIWTDGRDDRPTTLAVRQGRFIHVGEPNPALEGPATRHHDAQGSTIIPGLIDSHVHMLSGGRSLALLQLREVPDRETFVNDIAAWAGDLEPGEWILGGRWSTESWPSPAQPTKDWIDEHTPENPAYLPRMDGHSALVNSEALRLAGIDRLGPPDPVGGVIDRDPETGEPTGMLRESAMRLVSKLIPEANDARKVKALHAAIDHALAHGITTVADIPGMADLSAYERLAAEPTSVRFFLYPIAADWSRAIPRANAFKGREGFIQINGFKAYLDGTLGSRTAYMREPFLGNKPDEPNWRGLLREGVEDGQFERNTAAAGSHGYQTIAHAIGDEANHFLLNTLESTYADQLKNARCRSEHAQHLLPEDIARFGSLGVIASMQPYHKADDGRYAEAFIGADRSKSSYAFKSFLEAGATVCFGSDWPVVSISPFLGLDAAVNGRTLDGNPWQTQENLNVEEALKCYTSRAAYAVHAENDLGRIEPGFRADFIILDADPFENPQNLARLRPNRVYVGGRLVFLEGEPGS